MSDSQPPPSLGRRILLMSLTWLIVGAVFGLIGGLENARVSEMIASMLGGMIVLPVLGVLLGLVGGDLKGTIIGAGGGIIACLLVGPGGLGTSTALGGGFMVIFGGLIGATFFPYVRLALWTYGMIIRTIWAWFSVTSLADDKRWVAGVELAIASEPPARRPRIWGASSSGRRPHPRRVVRRSAGINGP